jgi:hypothetical protein
MGWCCAPSPGGVQRARTCRTTFIVRGSVGILPRRRHKTTAAGRQSREAAWPSGKAEVRNTSIPGSTPGAASSYRLGRSPGGQPPTSYHRPRTRQSALSLCGTSHPDLCSLRSCRTRHRRRRHADERAASSWLDCATQVPCHPPLDSTTIRTGCQPRRRNSASRKARASGAGMTCGSPSSSKAPSSSALWS